MAYKNMIVNEGKSKHYNAREHFWKQETHQEMRQWTWTFFTTTSYIYYKALRPLPKLHNTA